MTTPGGPLRGTLRLRETKLPVSTEHDSVCPLSATDDSMMMMMIKLVRPAGHSLAGCQAASAAEAATQAASATEAATQAQAGSADASL